MFSQKMTHQTGKKGHNKIINMYPGYFNGTDGNVNSKKFAAARGNLSALTNDTQMKAAVGAVIGSVVGFTKDPTNGAYQWVGGAGEKGGIAKNPATNNATNVTNLNSGTGKGTRYHTFYSNLTE